MPFTGFIPGGTNVPALRDDFNRADSGTPGSSWSEPLYSGEGGVNIASNALIRDNNGLGAGGTYWGSDEASPDLAVAFEVSTVPAIDTGAITIFQRVPSAEIPLNDAGTAEDYFRTGIRILTGGPDEVRCSQVVDGAATPLSVESGFLTLGAGAVEVGVGDRFGFMMREEEGGTRINAFFWDASGSAVWVPVCTWFTTTAGRKTTTGRLAVEFVDNPGQPGITNLWVEELVLPVYPEVRAIGAVANGVAAISPGLPTGTVAGDLLVMFLETNNEAITVSGWTEAPSSPQSDATDATRLTVFYKIAAGGDATTTSDSGNHQVGRIVGIKAGTFDERNPFNTSAGGTDTTSDTSGSIPGSTTTRANCLILAACCTGRDAASTTEFSAWQNANLLEVIERIDNVVADGAGGGIGVAAGRYPGPGAYGATAVTYATASRKGLISLAVQPPAAPPFDRERSRRRNVLARA